MSRFTYAVTALTTLAIPITHHAAPSKEPSRGVAADGRVVISPQGVPPPWGHDLIHMVKPQYPDSLRAEHPIISGFYRLLFDVSTGHVRRVAIEQSSGFPVGDASIIAALQQWQIKPNTWKEFQVHVSIGLGKNPKASNESTNATVSFPHSADPLSSAVDAKGIRHRGSDYIGRAPWMKDTLKIVPLKYPYQAMVRHIQGRGLFQLSLDLNTGSVSKVTVIQSTGSPMLDTYTSDTLHRWRWNPGHWREVDVPMTFTIRSRPTSG